MIRNCKNCNKEFSPRIRSIKTGGGKFCSRKCSFAWRVGENHHNYVKKNKLTCKRCRREFYKSDRDLRVRNPQYCSKECYELDRTKYVMRTCPICHIEFRVGADKLICNGGKYCSVDCFKFARRNKIKTEPLIPTEHADIRYILRNKVRGAMRRGLVRGFRNGRSWESVLGYSFDELKKHLKKTMPQGFNWDDYIMGKLQIDHIIPVSEFKYKTCNDIQFRRCWSLSNLRLLSKEENMKKRNKLIKPYQMNLEV